MKKLFIIFSLLVFAIITQAQNIEPGLLKTNWKACWIAVPGQSPIDFGVYHFRKIITLSEKPATYVVHVSADNRYKLYVNGQLVSMGPARGDLYHWNFETVDIAPFLQAGINVVAATVWNEGRNKAITQFSTCTAFILQGNTPKEYELNTSPDWLCINDSAYRSLEQRPVGYYAADPGEIVNMNLTSDDWMKPGFDPKNWKKPQYIARGVPKATLSTVSNPWMLIPSTLPQMEMTPQRLLTTRRTNGITVPGTFPATKADISIPANSTVTLLFDQTFLTNAYPILIYSKGKNARIALQYAEALYDNEMMKGNRNEIEGKKFIGRTDSIICNGREKQLYTTLAWRTYRYLQLDIHTGDDPLVINDIYGMYTGYPFKNNVTFAAERPLLDSILQIGWRTARLCAVETYMDCPYYEQLQYVGDTRIQAVISYYNNGDDRLARNAINLIDYSRFPEGITQSRYPSNKVQIIPPFSLFWIGMVYDYYRYRPDSNFVKSKIPGIRQIFSFFSNYQQNDGTLREVPYWNFTDWPEGNSDKWKFGAAPTGKNGSSSVLDFQLLWAYQLAAEMEDKLGMKPLAIDYMQKAALLKQSIKKTFWDNDKKLFADNDDKDTYSQHANILAILTETVTGNEASDLYQRLKNEQDIAKASIYFQYYQNQAMVKVGYGNDYLSQLDIWKENIRLGMTTWGEASNVASTRSDCHAWGASPNIEFFRTVLGIDTDAPGFARVKIEPHLGSLKKASGSIPHPKGTISVDYVCNKKNQWTVQIILPSEVSGNFIWKGNRHMLNPGKNQFTF